MEPLLSDLLRAETRQAHHALDHHPALNSLVAAGIDTQTYRSSLESLYRSWAPLETAIEQGLEHFSSAVGSGENGESVDLLCFCADHYSPRRYALERDLQRLGAIPDRSGRVRFRFSTLSELVGGLYVYFGAQMGGKFIAAHLVRTIPNVPTEYFESTHSELGKFWLTFRHQLDSFSESAEVRTAVVQSANRVFEVFRIELG